ncbi:MAG: choice-of-anchor D domain-containing protein [Candidatus Kapaibacterium sp.]
MSNGSQGKEFVFCLPLNDCPTCQVTAREIYVTSAKNTAFYYEVPALGFKTRLQVKANQVTVINGASGMYPMPEIVSGEQISDLGLSITADDPVSVYVYNGKDVSSDGYLAIPVSSWGKEYYALSYPDFSEVRPWKGGFAFMAAEDNTEVEITLRSPSYGEYSVSGLNRRTEGGKKYGDRWKVTLNRGQVYMVQGDGSSRGQFDLSGSRMVASKPIGCIVYHQRTMIPVFSVGGGRDHICEMIPPTSQWGKTYVTLEIMRNNKGDLYRAVALQDGTNIMWSSFDFKTGIRTNGPTGVLNMKAGEVRSIPKSPEEVVTGPANAKGVMGVAVFKANKPFLLMHQSCSANWDGSGDYDPFTIYSVAAEQFTKGTIFQSPLNNRYTNHFFGLIAIGDTTDPSMKLLRSIKLDGKFVYVIAPSFLGNRVPGTNYYYVRLPVSSGSHTIYGDTPFGGEIYGYGQFDSYGWPAATAFKQLSVFDTLPPVLQRTEECGDFNYDGTELRNFKVNDTLNHTETGVREIEFVDTSMAKSYNYRIVVTKSDGKEVTNGLVPNSLKNERISFRLEVIDKTKDAYAVFYVSDRAFNLTIDTVIWNAPRLILRPDPVDFGKVRVGTKVKRVVWLRNLNDSAIHIMKVSMKTGSVFTVDSIAIPDSTGLLLAGKDSLAITITYSPVTEGLTDANFDFDSLLVAEACAPFHYYVRGRGVLPHIVVGDFKAGIVSINSKVCASGIPGSIIIQNIGTDTLRVTDFDRSKVSAPFSVVEPTTPPFPIILAPGQSVPFRDVCFSPTEERNYTIDVPFVSDAPTSAIDDPISTWSGNANAPGPYVIGNDWDSVRLGVTKQMQCWVGNTGTDQVKCLTLDTSGTTEFVVRKIERDLPFWVFPLRKDSVRVDVDFTPTIEGIKAPFLVGTFENASPKRDVLRGFGYLEKINALGAEFTDTLLVGTPVQSGKATEFVRIANTSTSRRLRVSRIEFINEPDDPANSIYPQDFSWVSTPPTDTTLFIGGAPLQLPVRFLPTKSGMERVRVRIVHNAEPITANPTGTWVDTVVVVGYGVVQNQPYIKGVDYRRVLSCNNPVDSVTVGNSAKAGSTNSDRVLDSLWISGPDASRFVIINPLSSGTPIVIKPNTEYKHPVMFIPEPMRARSYSAVVHARFTDGLVITDSLVAVSAFTTLQVSVNDPVKVLNVTAFGTTTDLSLNASAANWNEVALTRYTATLTYNVNELAYVKGSLAPGSKLDNTWKIDSVTEIRDQSSPIVKLRVTASGTTPVSADGDLAKFSMQVLIGPNRVTECSTTLDFLAQTNVPDTTRDECVEVTTRGNTVIMTGCYIDGRFINISDVPFALQSVSPQPASGNVAKIEYSVGFDALTTVEVISANGEVVSTPVNETQKRGSYTLLMPLQELASGMYQIRMRSGGTVHTQPLIIVR